MPCSFNQLLLFMDRKGNHKSSEWHWGLQSFASFPTKQVVYMRQPAIVLALEEKKSAFSAEQASQAADLGRGRRGALRKRDHPPPPPSAPLLRAAPHTSTGSSARKPDLQTHRGLALCPDKQVLQLFPQRIQVLRKWRQIFPFHWEEYKYSLHLKKSPFLRRLLGQAC